MLEGASAKPSASGGGSQEVAEAAVNGAGVSWVQRVPSGVVAVVRPVPDGWDTAPDSAVSAGGLLLPACPPLLLCVHSGGWHGGCGQPVPLGWQQQ